MSADLTDGDQVPPFDKPPFRLVRVHWLDAYSDGGWKDASEEPKDSPCISVGYLVSETKKYVRLAATVSVDDDGKWHTNATMAIPRGMTISIEDLKEG
jgi:hypothetical protein